ncbi:MAG: hypothetical protein B5M52_08195 [Helicobacteraceae bacterium 4484_230]|nr:MAG: hypothetical protein B5M52_08195 [Helicobacteraceae bacterium 4484_230]
MSNKKATLETHNNRQRIYVRYVTATLIDLVVLGLYSQYWDAVAISSFTVALMAALVLQVTMQIALTAEHAIGKYVQLKAKKNAKKIRIFTAWATLFVSKLLILQLLSLLFADNVHFYGIMHGVIPFLVVVFTMIGAEALNRQIYLKFSDSQEDNEALL